MPRVGFIVILSFLFLPLLLCEGVSFSLAWNSWCSCLSLLIAKITGMHLLLGKRLGFFWLQSEVDIGGCWENARDIIRFSSQLSGLLKESCHNLKTLIPSWNRAGLSGWERIPISPRILTHGLGSGDCCHIPRVHWKHYFIHINITVNSAFTSYRLLKINPKGWWKWQPTQVTARDGS